MQYFVSISFYLTSLLQLVWTVSPRISQKTMKLLVELPGRIRGQLILESCDILYFYSPSN